MTTTEITLIVLSILAIIIGAYVIYRTVKRRSAIHNEPVAYDKNGIPIIPRHERNLIDEPDLEDSISGETVITPDRSHLEAIIADETNNTTDNTPIDEPQTPQTHVASSHYDTDNKTDTDTLSNSSDHLSNNHNIHHAHHTKDTASQPLQQNISSPQYEKYEESHEQQNDSSQTDLFSSLASATENLMPVIDTAETPEFTQNSPVLDNHLLAEATQDQNSPLNNAEENINISLITKDKFTIISGKTLLALVDQYGLKYGAMNMFHRYENKDGTGLLWFSMMGILTDSIEPVPFDLNTLPETQFHGIVLFLSLPHPKALTGFDGMMSTAGVIATQLNLSILNEHNEPLTREYKQQLRQAVQEYQRARLSE